MILGIGTDIVHIPRIEKLIKKFAGKFEQRYFTDIEVESAARYSTLQQRAGHFAKRFAAKEAFVKALGTGIREGIFLQDIGIHNDQHGKPHITLQGKTKHTVTNLLKGQNIHIHVSLSDDYPAATAMILIEATNE